MEKIRITEIIFNLHKNESDVLKLDDNRCYLSNEVLDKMNKRDIRLITLFRYNKDKLVIRNNIIVKINKDDIKLLSDNNLIYLNKKDNLSYLCEGNLTKYKDDYYELNINMKESDIPSYLFHVIDDSEYNTYISGLFKIYYYSVLYERTLYNNIVGGNKIKGITSYLAVLKVLGSKYNISEPNVFIRDNYNVFDCLLLNDNINNQKYVYDNDDVKDLIEIKTNSFFKRINTKDKKEYFKEYLLANFEYNSINNKYDEDKISYIFDINKKYHKFIYISIYESSSDYDLLYDIFKEKDIKKYVKGIFVCVGALEHSRYFRLPNDYDLDEILSR